MSFPRWLSVLITGSCLWLLITSPVWPQTLESGQTEDVEEEVAQQLTNPIARLFAVPVELQYEAGVGPQEGTRMTINARPVVPFELHPDWLLITLTQFSLIHQAHLAHGSGTQLGLGDTLAGQLVTPGRAGAHGFIWGLGPVSLLPTATSPQLGGGKWAFGPIAVVAKQARPFTFGLMANHLRSVAGDAAQPDVNLTFLQPFVSHVSPGGLTLDVRSGAAYSWNGSLWNVPLDLSASRLVRFGDQPGNVGATFRLGLIGPAGAPDWMVSLRVTRVFQRMNRD